MGAESGSNTWYDLLGPTGYSSIQPGIEHTYYGLWPGYWDLWVQDSTGYWAGAYCPYLAAEGGCYWEVYDSDMQP